MFSEQVCLNIKVSKISANAAWVVDESTAETEMETKVPSHQAQSLSLGHGELVDDKQDVY